MQIEIALCHSIKKLGNFWRMTIKSDKFGLPIVSVCIVCAKSKLYSVFAESDGEKYDCDVNSIKPAYFEKLRTAKVYAQDLAQWIESDYLWSRKTPSFRAVI